MLAAWRAEIEAEPIPELIDLDTAVAAVVGRDEGRRGRNAARGPTGCATSLRWPRPRPSSWRRSAVSGSARRTRCPATRCGRSRRCVDPERAESVETKIGSRAGSQMVRMALATGDTETAARELRGDQHGDPGGPRRGGAAAARPGAGVPGREAGRDAARRARGPVARRRRATRAPARPRRRPRRRRRRPRPPIRRSRRAPDDPSVSQPVGPDSAYRRQRGAGPGARVGVGFGAGRRLAGSGSSEPEVTKAPDAESAPESTEGGADATTAPAPSGRRPAGVRGRREPAGVRRCAGRDRPPRTPRRPVPAGTSIDATGTATAS